MYITNDIITRLENNEIFVFGSNLAGIHGAGAALAGKLSNCRGGSPESDAAEIFKNASEK